MLILFEMANNHQGSVDLGRQIINEFAKVADFFPELDFAFKFQYRHLPTFMAPDVDPGNKYVKRFVDTNLSYKDRVWLRRYAQSLGFVTVCTPFDEQSVRDVLAHQYDILKVGSPSFTDWPLWDEIRASWRGPIIASCGGASEQDIDQVVAINEERDLTLMHCVSIYPTLGPEANVSRVGWLKRKYPQIKIGYSTHEYYGGSRLPAALALALGAEVFEKHVCIPPRPNDYSVTPEEMIHWLYRLTDAKAILGQENAPHRQVEMEHLIRFQRKEVNGKWCWKP